MKQNLNHIFKGTVTLKEFFQAVMTIMDIIMVQTTGSVKGCAFHFRDRKTDRKFMDDFFYDENFCCINTAVEEIEAEIPTEIPEEFTFRMFGNYVPKNTPELWERLFHLYGIDAIREETPYSDEDLTYKMKVG